MFRSVLEVHFKGLGPQCLQSSSEGKDTEDEDTKGATNSLLFPTHTQAAGVVSQL